MSRAIVERLKSACAEERIAACRDTVADPAAAAALDALGEALGDPVRAVARAASDALAQLAGKVDGVVPVVRAALRSDDAARRWHAALASARIEPPTPRLLPAIVEALASAQPEVRWEAARLLVEAGRANPEFLPFAVGLVANGDSATVRSMAVHCVRELGADCPESARALLQATRDRDRSVRRAALTALAGIAQPSREALERLREVASDPRDAASQRLAARALDALARTRGGARI